MECLIFIESSFSFSFFFTYVASILIGKDDEYKSNENVCKDLQGP